MGKGKQGHSMKKKLTKKQQKAQNHAKLFEMKKHKNGAGAIEAQVSGQGQDQNNKKAA